MSKSTMMTRSAKVGHSGFRICLYIRVSTEEQAANPEGSIRNQEDRLRAVVKLKNMEKHFGDIKSVYVETKSGKDTNRAELQKLLASIRRKEIDLVMVTELSRISRSVKDFSEIWELMQANSCGFFSLRENFDTTTAAGEMVLLIVATLAQFERRQISERVAANFNARAKRGLYNGGSIPFGYTRIEDKPGFLAVDEEGAKAVRAAFRAFLQEGVLSQAAKWLNAQGYRITRKREGGGDRPRLGFFTTENIKTMLRNRFYLGVKVYQQNGEAQEVEAVWPAIVERDLFDKVNEQLDRNYRRNKDNMEDRYPFLLTGLCSCKTCGDRMVGKSANGKAGKIPYYEHGWSTRKGAYVPGLKRQCAPYRILAKQLEPALWAEIQKLFDNPAFAAELLKEAKRAHELNPGSKEIEKWNSMAFSVSQQLELLAERLTSLPATISPTPIYRQMEKLEERKREAESQLVKLKASGVSREDPVGIRDFEKFLVCLKEIFDGNSAPKIRTRVIRALVKKVVITPEGFEAHFKVGETYVKGFLGDKESEEADRAGSEIDFGQKNGAASMNFAGGPEDKNRKVVCSNTCINGGRCRGRTCDIHLVRVALCQLS
jgi:site-specific DNA recombinase